MSRPPIDGPGHLSLPVSDLKRSRDFYASVLGLRVIDEGPRTVILAVDDCLEIALTWTPDPITAPRDLHFGFRVDSVETVARWENHLRSAAVSGLKVVPSEGGMQLYLRDPDHWLIEIYAYTQTQDPAPGRNNGTLDRPRS